MTISSWLIEKEQKFFYGLFLFCIKFNFFLWNFSRFIVREQSKYSTRILDGYISNKKLIYKETPIFI